jgi:hypothetical protein
MCAQTKEKGKFCGKFLIYFHIRIKKTKEKQNSRQRPQTGRNCEIHRLLITFNRETLVFGETVLRLAAILSCLLGEKPLPLWNKLKFSNKFSFLIVWMRMFFCFSESKVVKLKSLMMKMYCGRSGGWDLNSFNFECNIRFVLLFLPCISLTLVQISIWL